jgi:hypothetical protein
MSTFLHALAAWLIVYALIGMAVTLALAYGLIWFRGEVEREFNRELLHEGCLMVACGLCWWAMVFLAWHGQVGFGRRP